MAEKCVVSLQPEIGRELCLVKGKNGEFMGYKRDILIENLSERDIIFICIRCQGIMREVCTSSDGEQFCSCCKKEGEQANPNLQMNSMVLSFKCSCPLFARGCKWVGALGGCQNHLDTCGYVYEACKLRCGMVLQRNELKAHKKENCPQRIMECKYCRKKIKFCELPTHLDRCTKVKMVCKLGCGVLVYRDNMAQHLEQECGYVLEKCELGCEVVLQRRNLKVHERENCPQRIVRCKCCSKKLKSCESPVHLDRCPKVRVSCELGCDVLVCRENMVQHLEQECGLVEDECNLGCGMKLIRDELRIHVTDTCVQRLIQCEHCKGSVKFLNIHTHLDKCPKMEVSCELCDTVMCREDMTQHLEVNCVEKEIECPFAKYSCEVGLIKRKYLSQHLEEMETKHFGLKLIAIELKLACMESKLTGMETITEDLRLTVEKQSRKIREQGQEIESIKKNKKRH